MGNPVARGFAEWPGPLATDALTIPFIWLSHADPVGSAISGRRLVEQHRSSELVTIVI